MKIKWSERLCVIPNSFVLEGETCPMKKNMIEEEVMITLPWCLMMRSWNKGLTPECACVCVCVCVKEMPH